MTGGGDSALGPRDAAEQRPRRSLQERHPRSHRCAATAGASADCVAGVAAAAAPEHAHGADEARAGHTLPEGLHAPRPGPVESTANMQMVNERDQNREMQGYCGEETSAMPARDDLLVPLRTANSAWPLLPAETGEQLHIQQVDSVGFSPDGQRIVPGSGGFLRGANDNTVRVWSAETGEQLHEMRVHSCEVTSVAFSPDGRRIVSGSHDKTVRVWSQETGEQLHEMRGHSREITSVAFSPDGQRIVSGSHDKTVRVWSQETGEQLHKLCGHISSVRSVAFSPDGQHFVSGSWDKTVRVWCAETGEQLHEMRGHSLEITSVAFSPDGQRVVSGSHDKTVRVWCAETGEQLHEMRGHSLEINSVAFSPDGQCIVSGSHDKTVRVWSQKTGEQLRKLCGHISSVRSVAFSPDGQRIVSGSHDKTVRVWSQETGEQLHELCGHTSSVRSVAFSPDGQRIVSGSSDKTIRIWWAGEQCLRGFNSPCGFERRKEWDLKMEAKSVVVSPPKTSPNASVVSQPAQACGAHVLPGVAFLSRSEATTGKSMVQVCQVSGESVASDSVKAARTSLRGRSAEVTTDPTDIAPNGFADVSLRFGEGDITAASSSTTTSTNEAVMTTTTMATWETATAAMATSSGEAAAATPLMHSREGDGGKDEAWITTTKGANVNLPPSSLFDRSATEVRGAPAETQVQDGPMRGLHHPERDTPPAQAEASSSLNAQPKSDVTANPEILTTRGISAAALKEIADMLRRGVLAPNAKVFSVREEVNVVGHCTLKPGTLVWTSNDSGADKFILCQPVSISGAEDTSKTSQSSSEESVPEVLLQVPRSQLTPVPRKLWTVGVIQAVLLNPTTRNTQTPYANVLPTKSRGGAFQGTYVCISPEALFDQFVAALEDHIAPRHLSTQYFWLDMFCVRQDDGARRSRQASLHVNRSPKSATPQTGEGYSTARLCTDCHEVIAGFAKHLIYLESWKDLYPLQRSWGVWEIHGILSRNSSPTALFAKGEGERLLQDLREEDQSFSKRLASLRVQDATSPSASDKRAIDAAFAALYPRGQDELNARLPRLFAGWLIDCTGVNTLPVEIGCDFDGTRMPISHNPDTDPRQDLLVWACQKSIVGHVLYEIGERDSALALYNGAAAVFLTSSDPSALVAAGLTRKHIAKVLVDRGELNAALSVLHSAMANLKSAHGTHVDPSVASVMLETAIIAKDQGNLNLALNRVQAALDIRRQLFQISATEANASQRPEKRESTEDSRIDRTAGLSQKRKAPQELDSKPTKFFRKGEATEVKLEQRRSQFSTCSGGASCSSEPSPMETTVSRGPEACSEEDGTTRARVENHGSVDLPSPANADLGSGATERLEVEAALADPAASKTMFQLGVILRYKGDFARAKRVFKNLREVYKKAAYFANQEDLAIAAVDHELACVASSEGDYDDALNLFRRVLEVKRQQYGQKPHRNLAATMHEMACTMRSRGDLDGALATFKDVLKVYEDLYRTRNHQDVAALLRDLGTVLHEQGDLDGALTQFHSAFEIQTRIFKCRERACIAETLQGLARVLRDQGALDQALKYLDEAMDIESKVHQTRNHDAVAETIVSMAGIHSLQGNLNRAEALLRDALAIKRIVFKGHEDHRIASALIELARVLRKQGRLTDARAQLEEARSKLNSGPKHGMCLEMAVVLQEMAYIDRANGGFAKALEHLECALRVKERWAAHRAHSSTVVTLHEIACTLRELGSTVDALLRFRDALQNSSIAHRSFDRETVTVELDRIAAGLTADRRATFMRIFNSKLLFAKPCQVLRSRMEDAVTSEPVADKVNDRGLTLLILREIANTVAASAWTQPVISRVEMGPQGKRQHTLEMLAAPPTAPNAGTEHLAMQEPESP